MKQLRSDKKTLAWFKLAECVARGEKERALGVYRLLAHSFKDDAYRLQLEADMLVLFCDISTAIEKYCLAAELYANRGDLLQAIALYEYLLMLDGNKTQYMLALVTWYNAVRMPEKSLHHACMHVQALLDQGDPLSASAALKQIDGYTQEHYAVYVLHQRMVLLFAKSPDMYQELILYHLKRALTHCAFHRDEPETQQFLLRLELEHEDLFLQALEYIDRTQEAI